MSRLRRTQIYLPVELTAALDRLARGRRVSRAELLRQAAQELVRRESPADQDPILGVVASWHGSPGCVSVEHDEFLANLPMGRPSYPPAEWVRRYFRVVCTR